MNVLIACEESQEVCKAFRARGHRAFSCDLQECSGGHPEWHIQGDVLSLLNGNCDFITADCERIAVENPVGFMNSAYKKPDQIIHPYFFAESEDDTENYHEKRTCLWLKGLPQLKRRTCLPAPPPMYILQGEKGKGKKIGWCEGMRNIKGGQAERAKARSKTFPGIAKAMAEQWG